MESCPQRIYKFNRGSTMVIHLSRGGCAWQAPDVTLRRRVLRQLTAIGVSAVLSPQRTRAQQKPTYEAMLLSCIDPRIIDPVHNYMNGRGLDGKYSQFTIAGAAIAVEAPAFATWHQTFWD